MNLFKIILTLLITFSMNNVYADIIDLSVDVTADARFESDNEIANSDKINKCITHVKKYCKLSNNDTDRIDTFVKECKQLQNGKAVKMLFLMKSGALVTVDTINAAGKNPCDRSRYELSSHITDILLIQNGTSNAQAWMSTTSGQVYFMTPSERVKEFYSSNDKPYSSVKKISGVKGGQDIILQMKNGQKLLVNNKTFEARKKAEVRFTVVPTDRSLFNDKKPR
jgi:hypothetical protein